MEVITTKLSDRIKGIEKHTLVLIISIVLLSAVNIVLFGSIGQNSVTDASYESLKNRTSTLESYYDSLQTRYTELQDDYERLKVDYDDVSVNNSDLQGTLNDLLNHKLETLIEEGKNITLGTGENITLTYELPASGYADIELNSSGEVYIWVGSSMISDVYYARFPPFPKTSALITTEVPVSPSLILFLVNTEKSDVKVELEIRLIY